MSNRTFSQLIAARVPASDISARDVDTIVEHYRAHPFPKLDAYLNGGANAIAIRCICLDRYVEEVAHG